MNYKIEKYTSCYLDKTVKMWRDSYEKALGIKEVYSIEEHNNFLENILHKNYDVYLALKDDTVEVLGMIAFNSSEIDQLFIHNDFHGKGIGSKLLAFAKDKSNGELSVYTFVVNENAQHFYKKHGFKEIKRNCDNIENMEDVLFRWTSEEQVK